MEYDFRYMDVPDNVGCLVLNPPFQKVAFRLILKRVKELGIPLCLLYPPSQFFAETAFTIDDDVERVAILNECQIKMDCLPKRVIFRGTPKDANVKVDWFNIVFKPGANAGSRRCTISFVEYNTWQEHMEQWTANELALQEMQNEIDEEFAAWR